MIPKIIHYCWFGRNPLPELALRCIASWKQFCPDYEIIEWNEDNFDLSAAPAYVQKAYAARKWAFVTDYVRLFAMTRMGGVYMDTDVEVLKPLDRFLEHRAFSGFEDEKRVPTGIMACEKGFPLFEELLRYYSDAEFQPPDPQGSPVTNVIIITETMSKKGFLPNNSFQEIEGFALYPKDYFCPKSYIDGQIYLTENTYTIHHFASSWVPEEMRRKDLDRWRFYEKQRNSRLNRLRYRGLTQEQVEQKLNLKWKRKLQRENKRKLMMQRLLYYPKTIFRKVIGEKLHQKVKKLLHR